MNAHTKPLTDEDARRIVDEVFGSKIKEDDPIDNVKRKQKAIIQRNNAKQMKEDFEKGQGKK